MNTMKIILWIIVIILLQYNIEKYKIKPIKENKDCIQEEIKPKLNILPIQVDKK